MHARVATKGEMMGRTIETIRSFHHLHEVHIEKLRVKKGNFFLHPISHIIYHNCLSEIEKVKLLQLHFPATTVLVDVSGRREDCLAVF